MDFQKFFKDQTGVQYSIDDVSEMMFEWMPAKGDEGMSSDGIKKFLEYLQSLA